MPVGTCGIQRGTYSEVDPQCHLDNAEDACGRLQPGCRAPALASGRDSTWRLFQLQVKNPQMCKPHVFKSTAQFCKRCPNGAPFRQRCFFVSTYSYSPIFFAISLRLWSLRANQSGASFATVRSELGKTHCVARSVSRHTGTLYRPFWPLNKCNKNKRE